MCGTSKYLTSDAPCGKLFSAVERFSLHLGLRVSLSLKRNAHANVGKSFFEPEKSSKKKKKKTTRQPNEMSSHAGGEGGTRMWAVQHDHHFHDLLHRHHHRRRVGLFCLSLAN